MILVLDASALITLARIGRVDLLRQIAGIVHIPEGVYDEVVGRGQDRPGSADVAQAEWICRHQVRMKRPSAGCGPGWGAVKLRLSC